MCYIDGVESERAGGGRRKRERERERETKW